MTHGTLTNINSGVTIPATVIEEGDNSWISVKIDGSESINNFLVRDGWTFTPDKALPTEVGSVIQITKWGGVEHAYDKSWRAMLTEDGWGIAVDLRFVYSRGEFQNDFSGEYLDFEVLL